MTTPPVDLKSLFGRVLELGSPDERAAYLAQACGGDAQLRGEVESLLKALGDAGDFLEPSGPGPTIAAGAALSDEGSGTVIGPYKILEPMGEGGMGVVYLAEQMRPVRRKVALKVIKPGMDTRQVIARFEAERQALALMDHPNIARIFDGGVTESGRPYFVMELVEGLPITEHCDRNRLTPRQRLELFVPVCRAVQHAHQKGIIHRDLKPSNVLVSLHDATPVVKVIDFGVAKALDRELTDKTLFTGFAQLIGTPLYMSPEQAGQSALDTDTRSDIYALGVLLYELLTGSTPFDKERFRKAAYDEIRRIIREEEPPRPSTRLSGSGTALASISALRDMEPARLARLIRGELDWIAMKCLEKDRNRRYESADGLAADVRRYLDDEPVLACPPSAAYRLSKFARRNRGPVAAGLALASMLVLGIAGTSLGLARALRAERSATASAKAETDQRRRAVAAYEEEARQRRRARKAVDEMYTQVAQKWLSQQPRMEEVQREFLEKALDFYQEFAKEQSHDPAVRLETAKACRRVGTMQEKLGRHAESEEAFGRAIAILEKLAAGSPAVRDYREELANNWQGLGHLQMYTNRQKDAVQSIRRSLRIREQSVADFGGDEALRRGLAVDHNYLGMVLSGAMGGDRHPKEAREAYRQAVELRRGLVAGTGDVAGGRSDLGATLSNWGLLLIMDGDFEGARPLVEEAIVHQQAALKLEPRDRTYRQFLINHLVNLSLVAEKLGNHDEAVKSARLALAMQERQVEDYPEIPHYRHSLAEYAYNLGRLIEVDDAHEAEAPFRQAIATLEGLTDTFEKVPERRDLLADCHAELGVCLAVRGRDPDATAQFRAALRWLPEFPNVLGGLGRILLRQQRYAEAEPLLRKGLSIRGERQLDAWRSAETKSLLGGALLGQRKYDEAEPWLLAGYEGMAAHQARNTERGKDYLTAGLKRLVQLYEDWGQPEKAAEWRRRLEPRPETPQKEESAPKT